MSVSLTPPSPSAAPVVAMADPNAATVDASGPETDSAVIGSDRNLPTAALVAALRAAGCVFAEDEARVLAETARTPDELTALLARRVSGVPLEQVVGWAEFLGLRIAVEPGVFVPRRRTEFLVHLAAKFAAPDTVVVDLCCGTGAVGAALAALVPDVDLHAADIDPASVRCARRNLPRHRARVHLGDLYTPLPGHLRARVDLILANAPYVPTEAIPLLPPEARDHEPRVALDGGSDGLAVQHRVIDGATSWLSPGGRLLVESSEPQAPHTAALFAAAGLSPEIHTCDDLDATVVIGTTPS